MMGIETMKNVSPKTVDRSTLVQRSSIRLNPAAPREDRLREFIKQIRNPYCYLDGKTVVKISFAETDTTMEDSLYPCCLCGSACGGKSAGRAGTLCEGQGL